MECIILCDTSHEFEKEGAQTITVSKGSDSVDLKLVNMLRPGDIAVTQDYGLAALCLARGGRPVSQNGLVYDNDNIDGLLMQRHASRKIRMAGGKIRGSAKRTADQDKAFLMALEALIGSED